MFVADDNGRAGKLAWHQDAIGDRAVDPAAEAFAGVIIDDRHELYQARRR